MSIEEHAVEFAGLPVRDYDPEVGIDNPAGTIYRLSVGWDSEESITELLARFLEEPDVGRSPGIVIGAWHGDDSGASSEEIVEALVAARDQLPELDSIFLGDITREENEISWINQSDVTALFDAYPDLEHFRVRGGNGLVIGELRHDSLRSLIVESGGLDAEVVRGIAASDLPSLDHLELWLGTEEYGRTAAVEDLAPILRGDVFPALRRLGLRNCQGADEIAGMVALSPILARLEVLDLSLGDLGDDGARALVVSPGVARLKELDIHHHYVSDELIRDLQTLGIRLDAGDRREPDDWGGGETHRYISASE
jgi:hypothetical protein